MPKESQETRAGRVEQMHTAIQIGKADVVCIEQDATLEDAARLMREHHVGDLVVAENKNGINSPVGIITDRDIVIECVGRQNQPSEKKVSDIMSRNLATAKIDEDVFTMIETMKNYGISRLPLVDQRGHLSGIVTARKLFQVLSKGINDLSRLSERQQRVERESAH